MLETLLGKARTVLRLEDGAISLAIVSKNEMRAINREYRRVDAPTDVLAFDYGEILLCPAYIQEKYGLTSKREVQAKMRELFAHGLLHIAGFDHRTKRGEVEMRKVEEKIL